MQNDPNDGITDVVQNLPPMSQDHGESQTSQPSGTVVASDGTLVTLGEKTRETKSK